MSQSTSNAVAASPASPTVPPTQGAAEKSNITNSSNSNSNLVMVSLDFVEHPLTFRELEKNNLDLPYEPERAASARSFIATMNPSADLQARETGEDVLSPNQIKIAKDFTRERWPGILNFYINSNLKILSAQGDPDSVEVLQVTVDRLKGQEVSVSIPRELSCLLAILDDDHERKVNAAQSMVNQANANLNSNTASSTQNLNNNSSSDLKDNINNVQNTSGTNSANESITGEESPPARGRPRSKGQASDRDDSSCTNLNNKNNSNTNSISVSHSVNEKDNYNSISLDESKSLSVSVSVDRSVTSPTATAKPNRDLNSLDSKVKDSSFSTDPSILRRNKELFQKQQALLQAQAEREKSLQINRDISIASQASTANDSTITGASSSTVTGLTSRLSSVTAVAAVTTPTLETSSGQSLSIPNLGNNNGSSNNKGLDSQTIGSTLAPSSPTNKAITVTVCNSPLSGQTLAGGANLIISDIQASSSSVESQAIAVAGSNLNGTTVGLNGNGSNVNGNTNNVGSNSNGSQSVGPAGSQNDLHLSASLNRSASPDQSATNLWVRMRQKYQLDAIHHCRERHRVFILSNHPAKNRRAIEFISGTWFGTFVKTSVEKIQQNNATGGLYPIKIGGPKSSSSYNLSTITTGSMLTAAMSSPTAKANLTAPLNVGEKAPPMITIEKDSQQGSINNSQLTQQGLNINNNIQSEIMAHKYVPKKLNNNTNNNSNSLSTNITPAITPPPALNSVTTPPQVCTPPPPPPLSSPSAGSNSPGGRQLAHGRVHAGSRSPEDEDNINQGNSHNDSQTQSLSQQHSVGPPNHNVQSTLNGAQNHHGNNMYINQHYHPSGSMSVIPPGHPHQGFGYHNNSTNQYNLNSQNQSQIYDAAKRTSAQIIQHFAEYKPKNPSNTIPPIFLMNGSTIYFNNSLLLQQMVQVVKGAGKEVQPAMVKLLLDQMHAQMSKNPNMTTDIMLKLGSAMLQHLIKKKQEANQGSGQQQSHSQGSMPTSHSHHLPGPGPHHPSTTVSHQAPPHHVPGRVVSLSQGNFTSTASGAVTVTSSALTGPGILTVTNKTGNAVTSNLVTGSGITSSTSVPPHEQETSVYGGHYNNNSSSNVISNQYSYNGHGPQGSTVTTVPSGQSAVSTSANGQHHQYGTTTVNGVPNTSTTTPTTSTTSYANGPGPSRHELQNLQNQSNPPNGLEGPWQADPSQFRTAGGNYNGPSQAAKALDRRLGGDPRRAISQPPQAKIVPQLPPPGLSVSTVTGNTNSNSNTVQNSQQQNQDKKKLGGPGPIVPTQTSTVASTAATSAANAAKNNPENGTSDMLAEKEKEEKLKAEQEQMESALEVPYGFERIFEGASLPTEQELRDMQQNSFNEEGTGDAGDGLQDADKIQSLNNNYDAQDNGTNCNNSSANSNSSSMAVHTMMSSTSCGPADASNCGASSSSAVSSGSEEHGANSNLGLSNSMLNAIASGQTQITGPPPGILVSNPNDLPSSKTNTNSNSSNIPPPPPPPLVPSHPPPITTGPGNLNSGPSLSPSSRNSQLHNINICNATGPGASVSSRVRAEPPMSRVPPPLPPSSYLVNVQSRSPSPMKGGHNNSTIVTVPPNLPPGLPATPAPAMVGETNLTIQEQLDSILAGPPGPVAISGPNVNDPSNNSPSNAKLQSNLAKQGFNTSSTQSQSVQKTSVLPPVTVDSTITNSATENVTATTSQNVTVPGTSSPSISIPGLTSKGTRRTFPPPPLYPPPTSPNGNQSNLSHTMQQANRNQSRQTMNLKNNVNGGTGPVSKTGSNGGMSISMTSYVVLQSRQTLDSIKMTPTMIESDCCGTGPESKENVSVGLLRKKIEDLVVASMSESESQQQSQTQLLSDLLSNGSPPRIEIRFQNRTVQNEEEIPKSKIIVEGAGSGTVGMSTITDQIEFDVIGIQNQTLNNNSMNNLNGNASSQSRNISNNFNGSDDALNSPQHRSPNGSPDDDVDGNNIHNTQTAVTGTTGFEFNQNGPTSDIEHNWYATGHYTVDGTYVPGPNQYDPSDHHPNAYLDHSNYHGQDHFQQYANQDYSETGTYHGVSSDQLSLPFLARDGSAMYNTTGSDFVNGYSDHVTGQYGSHQQHNGTSMLNYQGHHGSPSPSPNDNLNYSNRINHTTQQQDQRPYLEISDICNLDYLADEILASKSRDQVQQQGGPGAQSLTTSLSLNGTPQLSPIDNDNSSTDPLDGLNALSHLMSQLDEGLPPLTSYISPADSSPRMNHHSTILSPEDVFGGGSDDYTSNTKGKQQEEIEFAPSPRGGNNNSVASSPTGGPAGHVSPMNSHSQMQNQQILDRDTWDKASAYISMYEINLAFDVFREQLMNKLLLVIQQAVMGNTGKMLSFRRFSLTQLKKWQNSSPASVGPSRRFFRAFAKLARMATLKTFELTNISVGDNFVQVMTNGSYSGVYQKSPRRTQKMMDDFAGQWLWGDSNPFLQERKRSRFARRVETLKLDSCDLCSESAQAIAWFVLGCMCVTQDDIQNVHNILNTTQQSKTLQSLGLLTNTGGLSIPSSAMDDQVLNNSMYGNGIGVTGVPSPMELPSPMDHSGSALRLIEMTLPSLEAIHNSEILEQHQRFGSPSPNDNTSTGDLNQFGPGLSVSLLSPSCGSALSTCVNLDLSGNQLGYQGASILATALKYNASVKTLDLSRNAITHHAGKPISEMLRVNTTLQSLILFGNTIENWGVSPISEGLLNNNTLLELNLKKNAIFANGAFKLSQALKYNQSLKKLDLSWNKVKEDGSLFLAEMLECNRTLEELSLEWNPLLDAGVASLAEALGRNPNTSLRVLNLGWTRVNQTASLALAETLHTNRSLRELNLNNNYTAAIGTAALAAALSSPQSLLEALDLTGNELGDSGATSIAEMLKRNRTLMDLNLCSNHIGEPGALALADAMRQNRVLMGLNLQRNGIIGDGAKALGEALECREQC